MIIKKIPRDFRNAFVAMLKYGFEQFEIRTIYFCPIIRKRGQHYLFINICVCVTTLIDFVAVIHKLYKVVYVNF